MVTLRDGFPHATRAYDAAAAVLAGEGCRVIVPHLRGYGPTRFLAPETPRSEAALARQPAITVPTVVLHGADDGVDPPEPDEDLSRFTGPCRREIVAGVGHNLPQEVPDAFVRAVLSLP